MSETASAPLSPTHVACMKWGTAYGPEYVNRLYAGVRRNVTGPLRFFCMTDDPTGLDAGIEILPLAEEPFFPAMFAEMRKHGYHGALRKLSLFRAGAVPGLSGPLLILDIDVVVTGSLDDLMTWEPGKVCMRREWTTTGSRASRGHGSVLRMDPAIHTALYDAMARDPEGEIRRYVGSEQSYTSGTAWEAGYFAPFPDQWIVSFKRACRPPRPLNLFLEPRLPRDARIVAFHGRPKIEEAMQGYTAGGLGKRVLPTRWLRKHWLGES